MGNSLNSSQRADAFYFEVLEMSLAELDTKKSIKLTWLSEGITREVYARSSIAPAAPEFTNSCL